MSDFNEENVKKFFNENWHLNIQTIDESAPTPYEHMVNWVSADGVLMAMGYRHGRIEIFEAVQKDKPAER